MYFDNVDSFEEYYCLSVPYNLLGMPGYFFNIRLRLRMVAPTYNPKTQEAETRGLPQVQVSLEAT